MRNSEIIKHLSVLSLYVFLSVAMTYPLILKINTSISEVAYGDPLWNTWALAWDVHKIIEFDLAGLFDANIFHPYKNTLAYSDHMVGSAIFALPIIVFFKNPILAYNIILLMGMSLSGFGMYLLSHYLTGNRLSSFCGGLIFAFFPWRFGHIGHLQLQVAQWIPLTFLYIHKFMNNGRYKHLLLFTLFFILQCLSNGYYAMFLSLFVGLIFIMEIYKRGYSDRPFLYKWGLFFLISAIFILPFFYPYIKVKHEMGFTRSVGEAVMFSADILSYFAAPLLNRPWGEITRSFWKPEGDLFLGLTAMLLAIIGIVSQRMKNTGITADENPSPLPLPSGERGRVRGGFLDKKTKVMRFLSRTITILSFIVLFEILLIIITGGLNFTIMGIKVRSTRIHNPATILFILILARLLIEQRFRSFISSIYFSMGNYRVRFYFIALIISFIFSLGPIIHFNNKEIMYGPYFILRLLPGFDGLRVPARFIIMVAMCVSIFASFGVLRILRGLSAFWKRAAVTAIIVLLVLFESFSAPLPTQSVAVGKDIPEVYRWLAADKNDFAILEMPLPRNLKEADKEARYMYYSTYHWKKLVNGYSGYFPPAYIFLIYEGMKDFPDDNSISLLKGLNIKYLILHSQNFTQGEWERIKRDLQNYESVLSPFRQFGEVYVYEVNNDYESPSQTQSEIPRHKWSLNASGEGAEYAIDGDLKTRWTTAHPQNLSDYFEIDFGETRSISEIIIELGADSWDYPREYRIESSKDGKTWDIVKMQNNAAAPFISFVRHPHAVEFKISFPTVSGRFIKIIQTGKSQNRYWSIREIHLYE